MLPEQETIHRRVLAFSISGLPGLEAPDCESSWENAAFEAARKDLRSRQGAWPAPGPVVIDIGLAFSEKAASQDEVGRLAQRVLDSMARAGALQSTAQAREAHVLAETGRPPGG